MSLPAWAQCAPSTLGCSLFPPPLACEIPREKAGLHLASLARGTGSCPTMVEWEVYWSDAQVSKSFSLLCDAILLEE